MEWEGQVYAFATLLREMEIDADLDLFHSSEPTDWARFGQRAIRESDYVLVAVSQTWRRAWDGELEAGNSSGTVAETNQLRGLFQRDPDEFLRRVIPVTLPGVSVAEIPEELRATSHWSRVTPLDETGIEDLYRRLTRQPAYPKPPLGRRRSLGPQYPVAGDDGLLGDVRAVDEALASLPSKPDAGTGEARAHSSLTKRREALVAELRQQGHDEVERGQLDPTLLRGRIFPNQFAASVSASEKVLAVRAGIAGQLPGSSPPMIDSSDEKVFLDLVKASSLEAWAKSVTSRSEGWRSIEPTSSSVVTLRRPPTASVIDGWEVECRSFVTVTPYPSLQPVGHGILIYRCPLPTDGRRAVRNDSDASRPLWLALRSSGCPRRSDRHAPV